jgi:DNA repair protein SbcC/Rad50
VIIERIKLVSFAGVSSRTVEFTPGLNIVFGENEAGKSTIFNAIEHALLTPSKLTKTRLTKEMGRYLPAGGGDTVKVDLDFSTDTGAYTLKKSWGAAASVELGLPDGSLVTDDAAVAGLLEGLLPASPAVMKAVFLTYQSGMERLLSDLESSNDALFDLREVLRQALDGGDGYSSDRFMSRVRKEIDVHYGRWDKTTGGPEQGRGISNPWKQGCGRILSEWYAVENLKSDLEKTTHGEDELAIIAGNLEKAVQEQKQVTAFLGDHEKARDFASVRGETLREIEYAEKLEEDHAAVYDQWPKDLERQGESIAALEKKKLRVDELVREKEKARENDRKKSRLKEVASKVQNAREYSEALALAQKKLETGTLISNEAFAGLREQVECLEKLEREISAGSLSLAVEAQKDVELVIRKGVDEPEQVSIKEGERVSFGTEGAVSIGHHDFTITVGPGMADFPALEEEYRGTFQKLSETLASMGVESTSEAAERNGEYTKITRDAEVAGKLLEAALAGETLANLEAELSSATGEAKGLPIEEIQEELTTTEHEIKNLEAGLTDLDTTLKGYVSDFDTREAVLDLLLTDREKKKELNQRIEDGPVLPSGFDDWPSVVKACSDNRLRADTLSGQILDLEKRKTELVTGMPDESAEETGLRLNQAERKLEKALARASALERILKKTHELLAQGEVEITDELRQSFEENLKEITGGKYAESRFAGDLPDGVLREDGVALPFSQLSSGTRDGFSLALRLAMARCFVGDAEGFVVMDDPLVDMDDRRRPAASAVLETYSAGVQTIVFTCHENHAALFDEKRVIRLN